MALLRRVARPMLAAIFISGGINELRSAAGHAEMGKPAIDTAKPVLDKVVEIAPIDQRPDDETLAKIDGAVKLVAGSLLALGKLPRLSSLALAGTLVPATLTHRFWEIDDAGDREAQQINFFKNVSLFGGLLIAAADTHGKPSAAYRRRQAAKLAKARAAERKAAVTGAARERRGAASGLAAGLVGIAPGTAAGRSAAKAGTELSRRAAKSSKKAQKRAAKLQQAVEKRGAEWQAALEKRGADWKQQAKRGAKWQKEAERRRLAWEKQANKAVAKARKKAPQYTDQLSSLASEAGIQASKLRGDLASRASDVGAAAGGAARDVRKRAKAVAS